jgi:signal transduction histidine kinase
MDILSQEIAIILIGSTFFLLVAVGIIVLLLIYQKKQLQFILEKQELRNQFQQELLNARLEAQEETLNQVGRELHDNVGQLLGSSKLLIGVVRRATLAPAEELSLAEITVSRAINELRALSKSLNKDWLEKFNFIQNLTTEAARINGSKELSMSLDHPDEIYLPAERQLVLFRMVQEAFQNSLEHGRSKQIKISVRQDDSLVQVMVEDDGSGFDVSDSSRFGVGMINIRNRAQSLGGRAVWRSTEKGTSVTIQIPVQL